MTTTAQHEVETQSRDVTETAMAFVRGSLKTEGMGILAPGGYLQTPLPYSLESLAPHYEPSVLHKHYHGYHAESVAKLNENVRQVYAAAHKRDAGQVRTLFRLTQYLWSDHVLHNLFWRSMSPRSARMSAELTRAFFFNFGSIRHGLRYFMQMARQMNRRGWAVLAYDPAREKLSLFQTGELVNLAAWPVAPLLVCDLWEHAYADQYGDDVRQWVENFLKIVDWPRVHRRYEAARQGPGPASQTPHAKRPIADILAWASL